MIFLDGFAAQCCILDFAWFWLCCSVFCGGILDELCNHLLALSLVNTIKLVVLLGLGTKEFVE